MVRLFLFGIRKIVFKEKLLALTIAAVTFRCQCNCIHCSAGRYEKWADELDTQQWKRVIDEVCDLGTPRIHFTGGEPLLRKDIFALVAYAAKKGLIVFLETNGILLTVDTVKKLKFAGISSINISLDSAECQIHDSLRGFKGVFKKAIEGIEICKRESIPVMISTYASKRAVWSGDLRNLVKLAKKMKVSAIRVLPPQPSGRWLKNYSEKLNPKDEIEVNKAKLASLPFLNRIRLPICPINQKYTVFINPLGEVQPCAHLPFSFGNVKEERLCDIIEHMACHKMFSGRQKCLINDPGFRRNYIDRIKDSQDLPIPITS